MLLILRGVRTDGIFGGGGGGGGGGGEGSVYVLQLYK